MALERKSLTVRTLAKRHRQSLTELHPELEARVRGLLADLGNRFMIWTGHRGKTEQQSALARGASHARWLESPHNYKPSFAVDVVCNPGVLDLAPHPEDDRYPNLWDPLGPWADLERMAVRHHLERVDVRGRRDLPHLQLPNWRAMADRGRRVL